MKANSKKIKEYDVVKIKASGIIGTVVDIYKVENKEIFTVEDNQRNKSGGFDLYHCSEDEIESFEILE